MITRADIVRVARTYIGTPFHHRERQPGVAIDCAGILICVGRELGIFAPDFDVPDYTTWPDGSMLTLMDRYMGKRLTRRTMGPGDAIVMITETEPQHLGILCEDKYGTMRIIHAMNDPRRMCVTEQRLMFSRHQRFCAAYAFPLVAD